MANKIRIDKYLGEMEIGTRSEVKKMIQNRRVCINEETITNPGYKLTPNEDTVFVDGHEITYQKYVYYMFYKPAGCVSANVDNVHKTVMEYLSDAPGKNLSVIGRLDLDTEGLMLISNDGEFSHSLLSPKKHVSKEYYAIIKGKVDETDCKAFEQGIDIGEDKPCKSAVLNILKSDKQSEVLITITEGKFHQVKRMVAALGKEVIYLKRMKMGRYQLDENLNPGEYRTFTKEEINDVERYKRGII
ncbi:MAG: rRNA pseudouridine synthase [Eubacterium sp.]|nr:rRNA pseudouridine synthase [Eubacterium sp.]